MRRGGCSCLNNAAGWQRPSAAYPGRGRLFWGKRRGITLAAQVFLSSLWGLLISSSPLIHLERDEAPFRSPAVLLALTKG